MVNLKISSLIILILLFGCTNLNINTKSISEDCIKIIYDGDFNEKLNIVFIPEYYSNEDSNLFISDVNKHIDLDGDNFGLLSVEPFKSNKNKINFYRVDAFDNLTCYKKGMSFWVHYPCTEQVRNLADKCPHDIIIVLINKNISGINIGESVYSGTSEAIIFVDRAKPRRTVHEFGHAFGDLSDEYPNLISTNMITTNPFTSKKRENCDVEGCPKWCSGELNTSNSLCYSQYLKYKGCLKGGNTATYCYDLISHINHTSFSLEDCNLGVNCEEGTGCYWNCQSGRLFRSSKRGIMFSPNSEPFEFNKINQKLLLKKLNEFK